MTIEALTGTRIRNRRIDQGIRQADLSRSVGISAPYLNLIEHNRRRIAGKLLGDIARVLGVQPEQLSIGADTAMLDQLRAAAADLSIAAEVARADDFASRYPGWAAVIVAQSQRMAALQDRVQALNDRMTYDPELAGSLHQVISAVTSVRSAASILVSGERLDADWQARFHRNIYDDSVRLAASSEALIRYLDTPDVEGAQHMAPIDEVEAALAQHGFHIATLEGARPQSAEAVLRAMAMTGPAASDLMARVIAQYQADAAAMPLAKFGKAATVSAHDPVQLAQMFGVPVDAVLRRLASLPAGDHPPMGLVVADASGALLLSKPVQGLALPRAGAGCPLWPIFSAFARPDQPLRAAVALPDAAQTYRCYAVATSLGAAGFDAPPVLRATMLVMPDATTDSTQAIAAGVSCRICPRENCLARREVMAVG